MTPTEPSIGTRQRFERPLRIRFGHCDPAGIVFFPQYFIMLNGLVEDWVTEGLGVSYAELLGPRRIGLPTVSLSSDFKSVSRMGDDVTLGLELAHLGTRSLTVAMDCRGADGELRMSAQQVIVCTSLDSHRAITMPPDLRSALEAFAQPLIGQ